MKSFKRGIHPPGNKALAKDMPIEDFPLCKTYRVLTQQHIGAPAKPIVEPGDLVKKGQVLSEPLGFVSAPVFAPTSGTVKEIGSCTHPVTGMSAPCIVIEADGNDEWAEGLPLNRDPERMSKEDLLAAIKDAGIVGMGGATFPTHVKLSPPKDKVIDKFIINGAECEPYLTPDYRMMLEEPGKIFAGIKIVMKILGLDEAILAVEANKPDAIKHLRKQAPDCIKVEYVKVKYPQGAEKQLIYACTGREVPCGALPMDVGCVVQNVGTCAAIYDACARAIPLFERVTAITGRGIAEPKNLRLRVGTSLEEVIEYCGGLVNPGKIIAGGPMMGLAQITTDIPIMKGTSGITILQEGEVVKAKEGSCISCGRCVDACPMGLNPSLLSKYGEKNMHAEAMDTGLLDCFECGCCTYVCPSYRPIVHYVKHLKVLSREASAKKEGK